MVLLHSSERTIFCGRIWRRKFLQNNTDNTPSIHETDSIGETNTIDASEPIGYTLKNNYLFIALMNDSEYALKMLVCALLGYQKSDIQKLTIRNPIQVGKAIERKGFVAMITLTRNRRFISAFWTLHYLKIIRNSLHHIGY